MDVFSSNWDGLHPSLIAQFRAIDRDGTPIPDEPMVLAPLVGDATIEHPQGWCSPFESMTPESKAPALAAMLESGAVLPLIDKIKDGFESAAKNPNNPVANLARGAMSLFNSANDAVVSLQGRTGVTKINSTQLYSGSPPAKISLSLFLRAWSNPKREVMLPLWQLVSWAVPQQLSPDGVIVGLLTGQDNSLLNSILPSKAPQLVSFTYGNTTYSPMVIENIEYEITSPRDRNGNFTECVVRMALATLTALDRHDVARIFSPGT